MADDFDIPPELCLDPMPATAGVALVNPDVLDLWELIIDTVQQQRHASTILNIGGVHLCAQDETTSIDQDVALAAIDAFGAIVATYTTYTGCPDGLAINDRCARFRVAPDAGAQLFAKYRVQMLPRAVQPPQTEVVIGRLPRRELVREQSPCASTPHDVKDCVQDFAERVQPRSTNTLGRREQRVQASELIVCQVGQVGSPQSQTPAIVPVKPARFPVFRQFLGRFAGAR